MKPLSEQLTALSLAETLRKSGLSASIAARESGLSRASYYRKRNLSPEQLATVKPRGGRPRHFQLEEGEAATLRWHYLRKGSLDLAVEEFLRDPACRAETAELLIRVKDKAAATRRPPAYPPSLRAAAAVDEWIQAKFRGEKHFGNFEAIIRRGLEWIDEDGVPHRLLANDLWESDDMSVNEPYRFTDPDTGKETVGRQTLITACVGTGRYQLVSAVGRGRDAYRVEDIADHLAMLIRAYGMPRRWRIERGVWENHFIDGLPLKAEFKDFSWGGPYLEKRWGGIDALFDVQRAWSSRGKGYIESSFNLYQNLMAHPQGSLTIGRERGEFEEATRQMLRAQQGMPDALAKFWSIAECIEAMSAAAERFNLRPKQRRAYGSEMVVPEELYNELAQPRRELPQSEAWRLLPVKKRATVRGGLITLTAPHYPRPFTFQALGPHFDGYLAEGHVILTAFHPGRPEEGLHVFHADMGKNNRHGWNFGKFLFIAPHVTQDVPQFDLRPDREVGGGVKKQTSAAVRQEFRAIKAAGTPGRGAALSVARDGRGQSISLACGMETPPPGNSGKESGRDEEMQVRGSLPLPTRSGDLIPARPETADAPDPFAALAEF